MNLPNRLTLLRIVLAPLFLVLLLLEFPGNKLAALIVFIFASITDFLDGRLARRRNQITNFGKFLDPLADKMLTTAAFLAFIELQIGTGIVYITFIVLTREFLITSLRLVASNTGTVIAANIWGKLKTVSQFSAIILTILLLFLLDIGVIPLAGQGVVQSISTVVLWISAVLTVVSGMDYLFKYKKFIDFHS